MNYFVLFSVLVIAACVVILLVPLSNAEEGFATHEMQMHRKNHPMSVDPSAAGQRNASSHAGSADGSSDHDHLLDTLLLKHDKLAEAFENRKKTNRVSATTTKKKGIASTGASAAAAAAVARILAERAAGDELGQITVGGGDDAHRNANRLLATEAHETLLLKEAQHGNLRCHR